MSKYNSFINIVLTRRMVAGLSSATMRGFESDNPVSEDEKRLLTFGAVLFTRNVESCRTLRIREEKHKVAEMLASGWDIRGREKALSTAKELSTADGHTPFADDVYKALVLKGRLEPIHPEDIQYSAGHENALESTIDRTFGSGTIPDEMTDDERKKFQDIILSRLAARINTGIECYKAAWEMLIDLGYTENELSQVRTTAAWDLGRTGFIARYCVKTGYMEEDEAWELMRDAADSASKVYSGWREYLAGYIFGRALGYCSDSKEIYAVLRYLLNHDNSPFEEASFSS